MRRDRISPVDASAAAVVSELEGLSIVPHLTAVQDERECRHGNDTRSSAFAPRARRDADLTDDVARGMLIAQIDTSVVNLAVKEISARLGAGVTALQWRVDAYNLV